MAENAAAHYREAAGYARQAGDLSSCTNLIGQMSRILTDQGHYHRALTLADGALHLAGTKAPARRTVVAARRSRPPPRRPRRHPHRPDRSRDRVDTAGARQRRRETPYIGVPGPRRTAQVDRPRHGPPRTEAPVPPAHRPDSPRRSTHRLARHQRPRLGRGTDRQRPHPRGLR
ncbi:hypothetical protein ACU686_09905 [Yinghuangia aomiensis]